jgi:hypothetical protein
MGLGAWLVTPGSNILRMAIACLLLALSGRASRQVARQLLGRKRTPQIERAAAVNDPKRTSNKPQFIRNHDRQPLIPEPHYRPCQ